MGILLHIMHVMNVKWICDFNCSAPLLLFLQPYLTIFYCHMVTPNGEKQRLLLDVLSNLPENVIDNILLCLPLRDAVRTSILSKKWRYNWCRLPQLKLDQTLWETTNDLISPTDQFLSSFSLSLILDPVDFPKIDNLIYFLSRSGIQHLVLQLPTGNLYKLPSSFFICLQLRHLTLQRCLVRPPPVFKGFDRLISLELRQVTISTEALGSFISGCPLLEHLVLEHSDNPNHMEINALKLRSFVFIGNIHFINLKYVPLLAKVSHESIESSVKAGNYDLAAFFKSIPALENLHWDYSNFR
ncbi:F-box/FBD/LRR-repeat protein At1g13570-like [Capsicum annuum]|uniref:F-box/FBD/LRR-repeat protein At1g13570-like n=1 Tax=Capsicum annuum TaxID=4072 RepID=UPI001FB0D1DD|nr:F-box/FBD/LRR-repeat protein At1g13570-like [Capsicum annuum]